MLNLVRLILLLPRGTSLWNVVVAVNVSVNVAVSVSVSDK